MSDTDDSTVTVIEEVTPEKQEIDHMELDTRLSEWCWDPVKRIEIINSMVQDFSDDYTKMVSQKPGNLFGLWRIESDFYERYEGKSLSIRGKEMHFLPQFAKQKKSNYVYFEQQGRNSYNHL